MAEKTPPYSSTVARIDDRTVLSISGELDLATVDRFGAEVREQLAGGAVQLDLHEVTFMDSSALSALVELLRESAEQGWSLTVGPSFQRNVRRLLEMTGMLDELPLHDQPPAA